MMIGLIISLIKTNNTKQYTLIYFMKFSEIVRFRKIKIKDGIHTENQKENIIKKGVHLVVQG